MENNSENQDICKDGGVIKNILKNGNGKPPKEVSVVKMHYVGWLPDGTQFDSSRDRDKPFKFTLGKNEVILGWEKVVGTMKKGEICKVTLKPEYAYGTEGSPKVPPNSQLIFEMELLSFKRIIKLDKKGEFTKKIISRKPGELHKTKPKLWAKCTLNLQLTSAIDGTIYEDISNFTYTLGRYGMDHVVQKALKSMRKGEKAQISVPPAYVPKNKHNIPPNTPLRYMIQLLDVEQPKELYEQSYREKKILVLQLKEDGNTYYEEKNFQKAIKHYKKALDIFGLEGKGDKGKQRGGKDQGGQGGKGKMEKEKGNKVPESPEDTIKKIKITLHLNLSMCYLKQQKWNKAKEYANKGLEIDPLSVKGLFRRGEANIELGEYFQAEKDLEEARLLDPENKYIKASILRLKQKVSTQDSQETMFKGVFEKMVKIDEKKIQEERKIRWKFRYQISQIWNSLFCFYSAKNLLTKNKSLWFYLGIPGIISLLYFLSAFLLGYFFIGGISAGITENFSALLSYWLLPSWLPSVITWGSTWILSNLFYVVCVFLWFILGLISVITFKWLILSITSIWITELSEKVENLVSHGVLSTKEPASFSMEFFSGILIPVWDTLSETVLVLFLSIVGIFPGFGIISTIISFLVSSYYSGVVLLRPVFSRRKMSVGEILEFQRNHWGLVVGLGVGFVGLMWVPVVGWVVAPALGTVAATLAVVGKEKKRKKV